MFRSINERTNEVVAKVTRVAGSLTLVAPVNYQASVLLKLVGIEAAKKYRVYAVWVAAGRDDADAVEVKFDYTGEDVLRVDVPEGVSLSADYLNKVLGAWKDPVLPPDTPVVKGAT
jgi:hypothetical protein